MGFSQKIPQYLNNIQLRHIFLIYQYRLLGCFMDEIGFAPSNPFVHRLSFRRVMLKIYSFWKAG